MNNGRHLCSGCVTVDTIGTMNIRGNMIPERWYSTILKENGKPYLLAIQILAEIVYWYKPAPTKDTSGQIVGYHKKFSDDLLQKSYVDFQEKFGIGRESVRKALCCLENLGVIRREFRTILRGTLKKLPNVMYIDLNPERLYALSSNAEDVDNYTPLSESRDTLPSKSGAPSPTEKGEGILQNEETNTKNTTEITYKDDSYPISPLSSRKGAIVKDFSERMDEINAYRKIISENIGYEIVRQRYSGDDRHRYEELYELICDVVCRSGGVLRIGGEDLPLQLVKSRFLKLNDAHLEYVMSCLDNTVTNVKNMRSYLLTTLYRSLQTYQNSMQQMANHGRYEYAKSQGGS